MLRPYTVTKQNKTKERVDNAKWGKMEGRKVVYEPLGVSHHHYPSFTDSEQACSVFPVQIQAPIVDQMWQISFCRARVGWISPVERGYEDPERSSWSGVKWGSGDL